MSNPYGINLDPNDNGIGDYPERCTACEKPKCDNCMRYYIPHDPKTYIRQFTPEGRLDGEYDTILDASEATGITCSRIKRALEGTRNTTDYIWKLAGIAKKPCYIAEAENEAHEPRFVFDDKAELQKTLCLMPEPMQRAINNKSAIYSPLYDMNFRLRRSNREVTLE